MVKGATTKIAETETKMSETAETVETTEEQVIDNTVAGNIDNILGDLKEFYDNFVSQYKDLTKKIKSVRKDVTKLEKKRSKRKGSSNSGIQKKVPISDELREFLGLEEGTLIARTEVNTLMSKYIKENGLQDPTNGQKLILDSNDAGRKLKDLLRPEDDVVLTYFKMQTYLKRHYPDVTTTTTKDTPETTPPKDTPATTPTEEPSKERTKRRVARVRRSLKEVESS